MTLVPGAVYLLDGMAPGLWDGGHPTYGRPPAIAAQYLGYHQGSVRRVHTFEVWVRGKEVGHLHMYDADLVQMTVTEMPRRRVSDTRKEP